jgi:hypothetical protein
VTEMVMLADGRLTEEQLTGWVRAQIVLSKS